MHPGKPFVALLAVAVGCGPATTTVVAPPTDDPSPPLDERWERARRTFGQWETTGWTADACEGSAAVFRRIAADAAHRGQEQLVPRATYMAGLSLAGASLESDPDACAPRVALGLSAMASGRTAEARRAFEEAARRDRGCTEAWIDLAVLQRREGRLDAALRNLRRALAIDSRNVIAFHEMALVHLARSDEDIRALELAAVVCRQAELVDDTHAPIYNTWGMVDVARGRVVEALAKFERAYTLDPTMFEAWMNFGQITLSFRGYADAERAFRAALELRPRSYDALIGLGVALRGLDRPGEARERYLLARRIDPDRPEAWFNLGVLHQDHLDGTVEDLARAEELLETFVAKADGDPDYAEQVDEVVRCCPRNGQRGRACRPGRLQNIRDALDALGGSPADGGC